MSWAKGLPGKGWVAGRGGGEAGPGTLYLWKLEQRAVASATQTPGLDFSHLASLLAWEMVSESSDPYGDRCGALTLLWQGSGERAGVPKLRD